QRLKKIAGHTLEIGGQNPRVTAGHYIRDAWRRLVSMPHGKGFDAREFEIAVRISRAYVMKLQLPSESLVEACECTEHQRWILELVQAAGEYNPENAVPAIEGLRRKLLRIDRDRHDLGLVHHIGKLPPQPRDDIWID